MQINDLKSAVIEGKPRLAEELTRQALEEKKPVEEILRDGLMVAMEELDQEGEDVESDLDIARILASARAVKRALRLLEPEMKARGISGRGRAIIGTAGGDLHDVGKNIVAIMFENVGYEVIDLGVDVSPERFVAAVKEHPDVKVVCISCLLTTSMKEVGRSVRALDPLRRKLHFRVMVGGAPMTEDYAKRIGADYYTGTGVEAAKVASRFLSDGQKNDGQEKE